MAKTVAGLFHRFPKAEDALHELERGGIDRENISIVANDANGEYSKLAGRGASNMVAGAGTGAAIGGVTGLILGVAALAVPGVGPIVAAGPLTAALGSAGVGAVAGGLIGALTGMNIPEEEARYYADAVRRGGALVLVKTTDEQAEHVCSVLNRAGAEDIRARNTDWSGAGWKTCEVVEPRLAETNIESDQLSRSSEPDAPQLTRTGARIYVDGLEMDPRKSRFDQFEQDYRSDFAARLPNSGYSYEQFAPAYRYGNSLASDSYHREKGWADVEPVAEKDWEERNPGTWNQVKEAVHYGWECARR